ncbi:hypothetical protein ACFQZQ_04165 [Lysobacter koreensis]|uniref:Fibronectin type-III domain-containing protein n=1 Tax=Lysobacter koreensis TaxID=266122 RepID=A0ABW2YK53_9GAMM
MIRYLQLALCAGLGLASMPLLAAPKWHCGEFSELDMRLEQNATDGDSEVVLFAKGQDEGLRNLVVLAPNRREVIANILGNRNGVGLREFALESAEPPDLGAVLASFPQGSYFFFGITMSGDCLTGTSSLSHAVAAATTLLMPAEDEIVPVDQLLLSWTPVAQAERYIVELNNEDTGAESVFDVFPPTTSLAVPAQFLVPGSEYQFVVGVKAADGNATFVETTFFTAP